MMKLTMAHYYLPNDESLHREDGSKVWGVDPDVVVDLTPKQITDLLRTRRDTEIIHRPGEKPEPTTTTKKRPRRDTQLDTAGPDHAAAVGAGALSLLACWPAAEFACNSIGGLSDRDCWIRVRKGRP